MAADMNTAVVRWRRRALPQSFPGAAVRCRSRALAPLGALRIWVQSKGGQPVPAAG